MTLKASIVTDFLGCRIRTSSLWDQTRELDGQILRAPFPYGDFHAEAIEWVGLLKSVRSAKDRFVALELGAGFGPWITAGGVAARQQGIGDIKLYVVEADPQHFQSLRQTLDDNKFSAPSSVLIKAAIGTIAGTARWPAVEDPRNDWDSRPILAGQETDYMGRRFDRFVDVKVIALNELLLREARWDMFHIDVQGIEAEICKSCLSELDQRVHWLIIASHSRKIDGDLVEIFYSRKWHLENEKPARFSYSVEKARWRQ